MLSTMTSLCSRSLLALLIAVSPTIASAQITPTWTSANPPGLIGMALEVDFGNHTHIVGHAGATMTVVVTKLGPAGTTLWQRNVVVPDARARGDAIAVDATGRAIVAGTLYPPTTVSSTTGSFVTKLDLDGTPLWQHVFPATEGSAVAVKTDAAGNAYVLSSFRRPYPDVGMVSEASLVKIAPDGTRLWERAFGAAVVGGTDAMAIGPAGTVLVTTRLGGNMNVLYAYDAAGNLVTFRTIESLGGASTVAVGPAGEIVVAGGGSDGVNGGYMAAKFDDAYNLLWRRVVPARGVAVRAAVDGTGSVVLTGMVDTNTGSLTVVIPDWLTMKLDANGNVAWTRVESGFSSESPHDMALGRDNAIYLTGEGRSPVSVNGGNYFLPSTLTQKLAPDGTPLWSSNVGATALEQSALRGIGIRLSDDGGVVVLAQSPQTVHRYAQGGLPNTAPIAMASASPSAGPAPLAVQFSSAGSSDADGAIASYAWSFGNGAISTAGNPSHTYTAAGSYTASLVVTDAQGAASAPATVVITANAPLPQPQSLTLASTSVRGGNSTSATVRLSASAGATVALVSSNPAVASVPASVTVPAGATSATVTVRTYRVRRDTTVTFRATANGAMATATLTVRK